MIRIIGELGLKFFFRAVQVAQFQRQNSRIRMCSSDGRPDFQSVIEIAQPVIRLTHEKLHFPNEHVSVRQSCRSSPEMFLIQPDGSRSEERREGKECRSRWSPYH